MFLRWLYRDPSAKLYRVICVVSLLAIGFDSVKVLVASFARSEGAKAFFYLNICSGIAGLFGLIAVVIVMALVRYRRGIVPAGTH